MGGGEKKGFSSMLDNDTKKRIHVIEGKYVVAKGRA
jgi:hypothetical protein